MKDFQVSKDATIIIPQEIRGISWQLAFNSTFMQIKCLACKDAYPMMAVTVESAYEQIREHLNTFHADEMTSAFYRGLEI